MTEVAVPTLKLWQTKQSYVGRASAYMPHFVQYVQVRSIFNIIKIWNQAPLADMKSHTITCIYPQASSPWRKYMSWLVMAAGACILGYAAKMYYTGAQHSDVLFHLFEGLVWFLLGALHLFNSTPDFTEITLKKEGIAYKKENKEELLAWPEIKSVRLSNNSITVDLKTDGQKELETGYMEYKDLQIVKEKLQALTESQNIPYTSKY